MSQPLNIQDCFNYYQKVEFYEGENQKYCDICKQLRTTSMCTQIYSAPLVLILLLDRGRAMEIEENIIFLEEINMNNYIIYKIPDNTYFLSGIITHVGQSGQTGHFMAFCRMSKDSKWYFYNDSVVKESKFNEINNNERKPYILFYQKIIME